MPGRYYVHIDDPDPILYGPYNLLTAQQFARIGSQRRKSGTKSSMRVVTRGERGPTVRVYKTELQGKVGERIWPIYADGQGGVNRLRGENSLTPRETPKKLKFSGVGDDREHSVKVVKIGKSYRAIPAKQPWKDRYLAKHPSWR